MRLDRYICWLALIAAALAGCSKSTDDSSSKELPYSGRKLVLFVGSASQPPTELAARRFEEITGARLELHFGGSGAMLSKMKLTGQGDIYFPGSSDYIEIAKRDGLVDPATETIVAYLVPAINVPVANPKGIEKLEDLARPGIRIGIARPDTVCVGLYAVELLESTNLVSQIRPNIVTHVDSCAMTAQIVALGQVDAVLGWEVFENWDPENIKTIYLPPQLVPRIGFLPAAISTNSQDRELAQAFLDFLVSADGQEIYRKWKYLTSLEEARKYTRADAPVGGEWALPEGW